MCYLCLLEIYMTLVWEILSAITDVHHQTEPLHAYKMGSADEDGGGPQFNNAVQPQWQRR